MEQNREVKGESEGEKKINRQVMKQVKRGIEREELGGEIEEMIIRCAYACM